MAGRLKGRVAVVTGSGQSIGRAIAMLMAEEGAQVVTNNRSPQSEDGTAEMTAKAINDAGGTAIPVYADVATMDGAKKLIGACLDRFGTIDILVNNAGGGSSAKAFHELTEEDWDRNIANNLKSQFNCCRLAVPVMKQKKWGRIINVISRVGLAGTAAQASYAAAKLGCVGLTFSLSHELRAENITVNALAPTANTVRAARTAAARYAATGRVIRQSANRTPEHVAPIAVYLASDAAAKINGQIFYAAAGHITLYAPPTQVKSIIKPGKWTLDELDAQFPITFGEELLLAISPQPPL